MLRDSLHLIYALGFTLWDVLAGCDDCTVDETVILNAARVAPVAFVVRMIEGAPPLPVRGWYRCTECNGRRGGSSRSRHLAGAAVDMDSRNRDRWLRRAMQVAEFLGIEGSREQKLAAVMRALSGYEGPIGLIVYRSGAIHVDVGCRGSSECDGRSRDYVEVK